MKTILFVDDETHVVEGLKRILRTMRHEWQVDFALSGVEALALMEKEPYDVIVSDMRMPGMSGAQLLAEVLKRHPQTVRIMLSGHSDHQMIMQSVGPTHQYLSKPCNIEELKATIANACSLRELLCNPTLQRIVSQMETLPSLPVLYDEMMAAALCPDAPIAAISGVIARDVGMTAKILQLVNSAFFGLPCRVTNVESAISMLGLDSVRAMVLSFHIFEKFDPALFPDFSAEKLWHHSLRVGTLAKRIAETKGGDTRLCDDSYTAGLLHDAGKLALALHLPLPYSETLRRAREEQIPVFLAEQETFGASHAEVGAYLMGLWGLPTAIVEALAFHHTPGACPTVSFSPLTAVYLAEYREHEACPVGNQGTRVPLDCDYLKATGCNES